MHAECYAPLCTPPSATWNSTHRSISMQTLCEAQQKLDTKPQLPGLTIQAQSHEGYSRNAPSLTNSKLKACPTNLHQSRKYSGTQQRIDVLSWTGETSTADTRKAPGSCNIAVACISNGADSWGLKRVDGIIWRIAIFVGAISKYHCLAHCVCISTLFSCAVCTNILYRSALL